MYELFTNTDLLGKILMISPLIFIPATFWMGTRGGYYDTDAYKGHGTAHDVLFEKKK